MVAVSRINILSLLHFTGRSHFFGQPKVRLAEVDASLPQAFKMERPFRISNPDIMFAFTTRELFTSLGAVSV